MPCVTPTIGILGCGVAGLTCANVLAEAGFNVTVIARRRSLFTTSSIAAAFWYPFAVTSVDLDLESLAYTSLLRFYELSGIAETGVSISRLIEYFPPYADIDHQLRTHWWKRVSKLKYAQLKKTQLPKFDFRDEIGSFTVAAGVRFFVPVIKMGRYLPYLEGNFETRYGGIIRDGTTIYNLEALCHPPYKFDLVVNCSGLGAHSVTPDPTMSPVTGQVELVNAIEPVSKINDVVFIHSGGHFHGDPLYIVPRTSGTPDLILGGTYHSFSDADVQEWKFGQLPSPNLKITEQILRRCAIVEPSLNGIVSEKTLVGLRPCREEGVRLKLSNEYSRPVIHNYGHGGAGVTLSWGCADAVMSIVRNTLC